MLQFLASQVTGTLTLANNSDAIAANSPPCVQTAHLTAAVMLLCSLPLCYLAAVIVSKTSVHQCACTSDLHGVLCMPHVSEGYCFLHFLHIAELQIVEHLSLPPSSTHPSFFTWHCSSQTFPWPSG